MNVSDDDWSQIFGCRKHGGKVWADHTMEEKQEDESHGKAEKEDQEGLLRRKKVDRDFDSGVVPDLHCDEGPGVWKNYEPGVGPIIRNQAELKRYCELTGHNVKGQTHIEERHRYHDGVASRGKKKVVVSDGFEAVTGHFRRDRQEILDSKRMHERGLRQEAKIQAEQEKRRQDTKKFFFMPK